MASVLILVAAGVAIALLLKAAPVSSTAVGAERTTKSLSAGAPPPSPPLPRDRRWSCVTATDTVTHGSVNTTGAAAPADASAACNAEHRDCNGRCTAQYNSRATTQTYPWDCYLTAARTKVGQVTLPGDQARGDAVRACVAAVPACAAGCLATRPGAELEDETKLQVVGATKPWNCRLTAGNTKVATLDLYWGKILTQATEACNTGVPACKPGCTAVLGAVDHGP